MEPYLTTKQVQDLLKVDRITVYRMLQDGRLQGVKIGNQWRFSRQEVERMLSGVTFISDIKSESSFPTHCIQTIQDLFSSVSRFTALVVGQDGSAITSISNSCRFCQVVQSSHSGRAACEASWKSAQQQGSEKQKFFTCHAGLNYFGVKIENKNKTEGMFLSGHFYISKPDKNEEANRIQFLAKTYQVNEEKLLEAAESIPVLSREQQDQLTFQPAAAVKAIESILAERNSFLDRLQKIADLTQNL